MILSFGFNVLNYFTPAITLKTHYDELNHFRFHYVILFLLFLVLFIYFFLFTNKLSEWFSVISSAYLNRILYSNYLFYLLWIVFSIFLGLGIINFALFRTQSLYLPIGSFTLTLYIYYGIMMIINLTNYFFLLILLITSVEIIIALFQIKKIPKRSTNSVNLPIDKMKHAY